ncbi:NADP-dependent oxidoreductase [Agromyces ramosus]|uniref:NADPH:quinone reductase-like Zn-dependent oxidoreductase n=1 Tax=Agromyces ramosus TaxID=33879 RepID=A0ABU0R5V3_9MICO|nr:NADP-dependent oxidoreductase [Agromyces ramosus]MDQ0893464.1 NADPH:quinone reductase-like Zn-dependent oxidoreductase [Agromyces ramosus]
MTTSDTTDTTTTTTTTTTPTKGTTTMRAIQFTHYGQPTVLETVELPRPEAGPGETLVRVAGTTFNQVDATIRAGYLAEVFPVDLPHVPGIDVSGTVVAVGEGVSAELVGQDVVAFLPMTGPGASAEFAIVPAELLTRAPKTIASTDAAALASSGLTAWQAIVEHAQVRPGQRVLVNGAGGGVGGFAVQLAAAAGATVIATASTRSRDAVAAQGASQVIDYTTMPVVDALTEPVDVVLNLVRTSPEETAALVSLVKPGGVFVSTTTPGVVPPGVDVRTVSVFVRSDAAQLAHLVQLVDAGELAVDVSAYYPLDDLATVHALAEAGELRGKVVLTPTSR